MNFAEDPVTPLSRNHHYVPKWVLRQWESKPGLLWVARFAYGKWRIKERSTRKSFSHEGLYDSFSAGRTVQRGDMVERVLSKIEDKVAPCWQHLRRQLDRSADRVTIDPEYLWWLRFHVWLQNTRTPHFLEPVRGDIRYGEREIARAVVRVEQLGGKVTEEERKAIEDGSMLRECLQNAAALSVVTQDVSSPAWKILMEKRGFVVGRVVNNSRFVISDNPVLRCNSIPGTGRTLHNPHVQLWSPISPRYALGLVDPSDLDPGSVVSLSSDTVREWNASMFEGSRMCAGKSFGDLSALVQRLESREQRDSGENNGTHHWT